MARWSSPSTFHACFAKLEQTLLGHISLWYFVGTFSTFLSKFHTVITYTPSLIAWSPTTLANVISLGETLALSATGIGVLQSLAMLSLGKGSCLVGAGDLVTEVLVLMRVELAWWTWWEVGAQFQESGKHTPEPWAMLWSVPSKGPLSDEPSPWRGMVIGMRWLLMLESRVYCEQVASWVKLRQRILIIERCVCVCLEERAHKVFIFIELLKIFNSKGWYSSTS